ncbi:Fascin [Acipenser ruthenus]|uniref:Fascin n=1 Tax=Acipenser ruthenus TaxID=7906 RepID=A0A444UM68_ACIRT|nr:Fascin [Acipenser ruthenus]
MATAPQTLSLGFINSANKYLTAESYLYKVNATASSMRHKQIWQMEFLKQDQPRVHLRSCFSRYLTADNNGKLTCDKEAPSSTSVFILITHPDGQVSLQSEPSQRYLGGAEDNVSCFAESMTDGEKWTPRLALHPSVSVYSHGRRRYMRFDEASNSLTCDQDLAWGASCVLTLYFDGKEKRYALRTGAGTLLSSDGRLVSEVCAQALYSCQLRSGFLLLRDTEGKYLSGRESVVKTFKTEQPGRDELFTLEPSPGQLSIRALGSGKFICLRPGADIYANQAEAGRTETFQIMHNEAKKTCFRAASNNYLCVGSNDMIVASPSVNDRIWFDLLYQGEKVSFKADDKFMSVKPNGQVVMTATPPGRSGEFVLRLMNRSLLILQSDFGFVGLAPGTQRLDGNLAQYEACKLTANDSGFCQFKVATGDSAQNFSLEFHPPATLTLGGPNGKYVVAEQSGGFKAVGGDVGSATHFHY